MCGRRIRAASFNRVNSCGVTWWRGSVTDSMVNNSEQREVRTVLGGTWFLQGDIVRYGYVSISGVDSGRGRRPVSAAAWEFECWAYCMGPNCELLGNVSSKSRIKMVKAITTLIIPIHNLGMGHWIVHSFVLSIFVIAYSNNTSTNMVYPQ